MKAKIHRNMSGAAILKHAPPPLRSQVLLRRFERESEPFTLLVFPSQRQDTVLSGSVKHILSECAPSERLVAFGGCFTLEAIALLKERSVEVFSQSEFPWTDERWKNRNSAVSSNKSEPQQ
jgi:hypothetical protein